MFNTKENTAMGPSPNQFSEQKSQNQMSQFGVQPQNQNYSNFDQNNQNRQAFTAINANNQQNCQNNYYGGSTPPEEQPINQLNNNFNDQRHFSFYETNTVGISIQYTEYENLPNYPQNINVNQVTQEIQNNFADGDWTKKFSSIDN